MKRKILVTGGAGYIGSVLVPELLAAGNAVTVLDSFLYSRTSLDAVRRHPAFELLEGDVRDEVALRPLLARADAVIPLAGIVGAPACERDPATASAVNREAVLMMLGLLSREQLVVMPTSNSAYGSGDANHFCDEESPLHPLSLYAKDKVEVERALMDHPSAVSLRLATVFGMSPRMRLDLLVNDFTWRALREQRIVLYEGEYRRNFLHVRDAAGVFLHALGNAPAMAGQIYNVGLEEANLSKRELCERIRAQVPGLLITESPEGRDPDQRDYIVSNAKLAATGFRARTSLDDGIRELIEGYATLKGAALRNA